MPRPCFDRGPASPPETDLTASVGRSVRRQGRSSVRQPPDHQGEVGRPERLEEHGSAQVTQLSLGVPAQVPAQEAAAYLLGQPADGGERRRPVPPPYAPDIHGPARRRPPATRPIDGPPSA